MLLGFFGLTAGGAALVRLGLRAPAAAGDDWSGLFDAGTRGTLEAAIERILPGALAAGVPAFVAWWLTRDAYLGKVISEFQTAAARLDAAATARHGSAFARCAAGPQDAVLRAMQQGELSTPDFDGQAAFEHLATLTLEGFLSDPKYGGNRGQIGWHFIGFKPCWWSGKLRPGGEGR